MNLPPPEGTQATFSVAAPLPFLARARPGDPDDPIYRQVQISVEEQVEHPGYHADPVGELSHCVAPGLIQKYHGRLLLVVTGACAVHCRYCFRRHFPYETERLSRSDWADTLSAIAADSSISEVILSGGDPLMLGTDQLRGILTDLGALKQVKRLRLHTRMPIVVPARITANLVDLLGKLPVPTAVVVHCNHAREIDDAVYDAARKLRDAGITLLNQAVLLRHINDSVSAQCELAETLYDAGILPYYVHLLDPVQGSAHFSVKEEEARRLFEAVRERLPGYLVPRLVREIEGEPCKREAGYCP